MAPQSTEILSDLIAFPTVSRDPNMALIRHVADLLAEFGIASDIIPDASGAKANLFATIGPDTTRDTGGGVILSGHTDVVPTDGQDWTVPPFEMTEAGGRLYGRGTTDMKGFVACAVNAACKASQRPLKTPLHLALSYDEEVGCLGVRDLIRFVKQAEIRPKFCIVGEPTNLTVATGHKGKTGYRVRVTGKEAHSALAPTGVNAIHMATDFIAAIRAKQDEIADHGSRDGDYDIAYTTLHVGRISGGIALNIVPNHTEMEFEIRNLIADDPGEIFADLQQSAAAIVEGAQKIAGDADIRFKTTIEYPGLDTAPGSEIVAFVKGLTGGNATIKVAYGTEGGLFDTRLGLPVVVCGPGSMEQGHKPDEFIAREQLDRCDRMLEALIERLEFGV